MEIFLSNDSWLQIERRLIYTQPKTHLYIVTVSYFSTFISIVAWNFQMRVGLSGLILYYCRVEYFSSSFPQWFLIFWRNVLSKCKKKIILGNFTQFFFDRGLCSTLNLKTLKIEVQSRRSITAFTLRCGWLFFLIIYIISFLLTAMQKCSIILCVDSIESLFLLLACLLSTHLQI